jgi:hypothetical protein
MKMYQFVVITGLISSFSLLNFYDRWQYYNMGQKDKIENTDKTTSAIQIPEVNKQVQNEVNNERIIYLSKLYMALGEISGWYIQKKDPKVNAHKLKIWKSAVFAKADQEKLWEQFYIEKSKQKETNEKSKKTLTYSNFDQLRFLSHNDKAAWKFVKLFIDSMENYHFFWKKAAKAECVQKGDVMAQARAAFSSYSGGMSQLCRWTNSYSKVSDVDRTFFKNMKEQSWKDYGKKEPTLEVAKQIIQKKVPKQAQVIADKPKKIKLVKGEVVQLPSKEVCLVKNNKLNCLKRSSDLVCLSSLGKLKNMEPKILKSKKLSSLKVKKLNRFETCENFNSELRPISSLVKTKKKIKLRATPGGKFLTVVPKGVILQVKDYKLESLSDKHAYYKVSFDGKKGYIYGGTEKTSKKWISTVSEKRKTGGELAKLMEKFRDFLQL